jgi:hypothetical protein
VPERRPVEVLNAAQVGLFEILNVSLSPLASLALGVNEYAVPTRAEVAGDPEIVGALFDVELEPEAFAVIENGAKPAKFLPSPTAILMLPQ